MNAEVDVPPTSCRLVEFLAGRLSLPAVPRRLSATDDEALERAAAVARTQRRASSHLELIAGEVGDSIVGSATPSTPT